MGKKVATTKGRFFSRKFIRRIAVNGTDFRNYLRMDETTYTDLLNLVTPYIRKKNTIMREAITPHERLAATLRFLATGRSYEDLKYSCAISKQSLSVIIPETCWAIYTVLKNEYMKFPSTEEEWRKVSLDFETRWQFPHCLGAVDGKHVQIVPPVGSGSYFYNYKGTHSVVLMAIANANYEFIFCDVGTNGRISDGGVLKNTAFHSKLSTGSLNLPQPSTSSSTTSSSSENEESLNYVFVADDAFTMRPDFLKPYPHTGLSISERIFNYRLSRARRIVENVFGILVHRFQTFGKPINLKLENIDVVVMACCVLHNYLRRKCGAAYSPVEGMDQENMETGEINLGYRTNDTNFIDMRNGGNRNCSNEAKRVRDQFKKYFNGAGAVSWQTKMIGNINNLYESESDENEEDVDDVQPIGPNGNEEALDVDEPN